MEPFSGDWLGDTYLKVIEKKKFEINGELEKHAVMIYIMNYLSLDNKNTGIINFKEYELESMLKKGYLIQTRITDEAFAQLILLGL